MAREIQRTRRTQTVSPSGTASRMGVVDVYTPNISEMFNVAANTMNTLAENQIKVLDAKWQNNFETETTKYINNKVDSILKSREKPDLTRFQEEADGYINGVLSNVPERLSISAEAYFNQKNLNAFEILRKQANIIEYQELTNSYEKNLESTLLNVDTFIENNFLTSRDPQESIDGLNNFFATQVTAFLGSHAEKYNAMKIASEFKLNDGTQREAEQGLLLSLEQKRVNAIVKSFFQNIDVTDPEQVINAENEAQMFLRNYSLNEGGVRGVNYEIFEDATGNKIGQDIIDQVVDNGISAFNSIKSLNDFGIKTSERKRQAEDSINIKNLVENISNVTSPTSNQNNIFTQLVNGQEMPSSLDEIRNYLEKENIKYTETELENIYNSNIAAFEIRNSIAIGSDDKSLTEILTTKENEKYLKTLGISVEDVVKQQIANVSLYFGIEDSLEGYQSIGPDKVGEANAIYSIARDNQVMPYGMEQLFKQINIGKMIDLVDQKDEESIVNWFDNILPQWAALSDNGIVKFKNLSSETTDMFSYFNSMKQYYEPLDIAKQYIKIQENKNNTKADDYIPESASFSSWKKEFIGDDNRSVTKNYINNYREQYNKYKIKDNTFFGFSFGFDVLGSLVETEQGILNKFNSNYISALDDLVEAKALELTKIDTQGISDKNIIENVFNENVFKVMDNLIKEQDYGVSRFAPNSGGQFAMVKDAMESVHRLNEDDAINKVAAFFNMYIKQNYDTDENLRNAFQNMQGNEVKPTFNDAYKFAEMGVFELKRIEGTDDYEMKLNLDNAMMLGFAPYPYAEDSIQIKVDGMDFNPTKMFNRRFDTYLEIETNKYLDDNGIVGPGRDLIKKFVMGIRQMDAPFDSTEFRAIDERFQNSIIDLYEDTVNNEAFNFSNIITNSFIKSEEEDIEDFLNRSASNIHNVIYEEGSSKLIKEGYQDNVGLIIDTFQDRIENKPGQVAFLLDAYSVYKPDINKLKAAVKSGKEKDLLAVFPNMGDYQKRLMLYLFSEEYFETN
jgi:hypothetical protein